MQNFIYDILLNEINPIQFREVECYTIFQILRGYTGKLKNKIQIDKNSNSKIKTLNFQILKIRI